MSEQQPQSEGDKGDSAPDRAAAANLERCCSCRYATETDTEKGTLICRKHNMLINAAVDEIPDDCKEYEK